MVARVVRLRCSSIADSHSLFSLRSPNDAAAPIALELVGIFSSTSKR
jgi:hypothetical protein